MTGDMVGGGSNLLRGRHVPQVSRYSNGQRHSNHRIDLSFVALPSYDSVVTCKP